jgi:glycosyltransferase involved in cell wall biosynthesis
LIAFLPSTFTIVARAARKLGIPYILSCHNVPEQDFESPDRWDQNPVEKRRRLESLEHAAAITVILPEFREWFPEKIRHKVHTIRNFITTPPAAYPDIEGRRKRVLAVGRISAAKDHEVLIRAWHLIHDRFPEWVVEIYGEGPLKQSLVDLIAKLSLKSRVILKPPTSDIWSLYGDSQIFCIPSKFEGFGLVTVEAMACGTPAIGFHSCPGTNRLIQDRQTGLLVECDDAGKVASLAQALERLIGDSSLRKKFSIRSLAEAENYFVEHCIEDWFNLIDSIPNKNN